MKLRNKKTGQIVDVRMSYREGTAPIVVSETTFDENGQRQGWPYNSLAELNEEWEDYEEPKQWYGLNAIRDDGFEPLEYEGFEDLYKHAKKIGIGFDTREEAEKAVEKLKAWQRLKDKGFRFVEHQIHGLTEDGEGDGCAYFEFDKQLDKSDLELLFGGEE